MVVYLGSKSWQEIDNDMWGENVVHPFSGDILITVGVTIIAQTFYLATLVPVLSPFLEQFQDLWRPRGVHAVIWGNKMAL